MPHNIGYNRVGLYPPEAAGGSAELHAEVQVSFVLLGAIWEHPHRVKANKYTL